jgi:phosphotransferase system enzyme I (PtsI)
MELHGTAAAPGVAVGRALVVEREAVTVFRRALAPGEEAAELERLRRAVAASRAQLQAIKDRLAREIGAPHAYVFDAQLLMLEDPLLFERSLALVREERVNAEWALRSVSEELHRLFDGFTDEYLKERSSDVDDVLGRVLINLAGIGGGPSLQHLPEECVLVADELSPSEAAALDWDRVLGIAVDAGSRTYHTAILARSLGIPAVVGLREATQRIRPGTTVIVDGDRGQVLIAPSDAMVAEYGRARERDEQERLRLQQTRNLPAVTRDGIAVRLEANVELPNEAATALQNGAEGIGLLRTEYLLGRGRRWPTEDEQVEIYRRLLDEMRPCPVTVRTWDIGAEDLVPGGPSSPNPALGERALRLLRREPEPFRIQLRALMRAAAHGPLRIAFPFIGGPAELEAALDLVAEVRAELGRDGREHRSDVPVGVNLEVPSAAITADLLARHADFFSVGTNDLIQYLLAVDRVDPRVSGLYQPLHPAVLRTLRQIVEAARCAGIPLSLCGEMAADPMQACFLLGLGFRELSMGADSIPRVKEALRAVSAAEAARVALECLDLATAEEVESRFRRFLEDERAAALPGAGGASRGKVGA